MGGPDEHRAAADAPAGSSIQERLYPDITCFGCGHANPKGLHLRSYPCPDGSVVATFTTWPEHDNGFGFVNGGIIATLLDCHSGAAVFHAANDVGLQRAIGDPLLYVTAGLDVRYRRPTPLGVPVELVARVVEQDDDRSAVEVTLSWEDQVRASARADWRRWRPRPA
ncbi:MAG: PaaI family thioesterase [Candidatus Nanopelagicales bacterium]|jgi:acyl-coenzyme A thioesterase PaaI-like protein|nr:PaaI family thioesterase [Candidatus Nanopelagicales bacterium]